MKTLLEMFDRHAAADGERPFVHFCAKNDVCTWSYRDTRFQALKAAALFRDSGLKPGSVVFIVLKHRIELYSTFLGAMYAGLIPAFLPYPTTKQDPELYWSSHRALFQRVEPGLVLTYDENVAGIRDALSGLDTHIVTVGAIEAFAAMPNPSAGADDAVALLQHSSGTTGLKKGVVLTFGEIAAQVRAYADAIDADHDDVIVSWLPLYHDMGLISSFLMPASLGATIVALDAFEWVSKPAIMLDAIQTHRGTLTWMPNFAFNHLARLRSAGTRYDLSSMRAFIACSEPCKAETFENFAATFADCGVEPESIQACYAMAETVFAVTQSELHRPLRTLSVAGEPLETRGELIPMPLTEAGARVYVGNGKPVRGLDVAIADRDGGPLSRDPHSARAGEIMIRGDFVFDGYYRNVQDTESAFRDGWYATGDIGFFADGELYVCGRLKEILIVHGRDYYATDIEEIVNAIPGVKPGRAVAFALFDQRNQSDEAIVVVETEMPELERAGLKRLIKKTVFDKLELTLQTVSVVEPGWLVKTTSGKISRKENLARYELRGMAGAG